MRSTAAMAYRAGDLFPIYQEWTKGGRPITRWGDDEFVRYALMKLKIEHRSFQRLFPGCKNIKFHKLKEGPGSARIVGFVNHPKPHEMGGWVAEHWSKR